MAHIVLIGAGSKQFGLGTLGDIFCMQALRGSSITLLDIDAAALKAVHQQAEAFLKQHDPSGSWGFTICATTNRQEALQGADFVIISIEVGDRFALWDMDRTIAQQYGIRQVYGENGGPGGLFHSLRIIPPILDICKDVRDLCPEAVVFNYSNPMSRICTTVHRAFPELQFIGLCHEIASLERYLPSMLNVDFAELQLVAGGLNHFSVLLKAQDKNGNDLYPEIRKKALEFFKSVPSYGDFFEHQQKHGVFIDTEGSTTFEQSIVASRAWAERGLFQYILNTFDLLPITTDSHFGEYLSWAYDAVDHRGIVDFYRYYRKQLATETEHKIELKVKERVAVLMEAMVSKKTYTEAAVNIPNADSHGKPYIAELPAWLCVEVPASVGSSIEGQALPPLPRAFAGLLTNQIGVHDMCAEAVLKKSKNAAVQALLVDPVVSVCKALPELVDLMIEYQKDHLGYLE